MSLNFNEREETFSLIIWINIKALQKKNGGLIFQIICSDFFGGKCQLIWSRRSFYLFIFCFFMGALCCVESGSMPGTNILIFLKCQCDFQNVHFIFSLTFALVQKCYPKDWFFFIKTVLLNFRQKKSDLYLD